MTSAACPLCYRSAAAAEKQTLRARPLSTSRLLRSCENNSNNNKYRPRRGTSVGRRLSAGQTTRAVDGGRT